MRLTMLLPLMLTTAAMPVLAADPKPEIDRP